MKEETQNEKVLASGDFYVVFLLQIVWIIISFILAGILQTLIQVSNYTWVVPFNSRYQHIMKG